MLSKYRSLIFLLITVRFISSLKIDSENENSVHHFPPNPKEVEECEKDVSKCQYFSTYPRSHVEKLIKKNLIKKDWFKGDKGKLVGQSFPDADDNFTSLCKTKSMPIYPQGSMTENQGFIYIVQMQVNDDYYYQPIMTGVCESKDQPCSVKDNGISGNKELIPTSSGIKLSCKQEKNIHKLIGVTINGTVVRDVSSSYGSFCVCKYCKTRQYKNEC